MKSYDAFFLYVVLAFTFQVKAQDTICTKNNYCFSAKILSVNRRTIDFRKLNPEETRISQMPVAELKKVKYQNGKEIYFSTWQKQAALGFTFYTNGISNRKVNDGKYSDADLSFSTYSTLFSFLYRGNVLGITLSTGYAYTVTEYQAHEFNLYPPYSSTYTSRKITTSSNNIPLLFTPRFNITNSVVNPFFDLTIGTEYYQRNDKGQTIRPSPFICKTGFGIQFCFFKHWLAEIKAGFGSRSDFADSDGRKFLIGNFELSFYRILYSHITH